MKSKTIASRLLALLLLIAMAVSLIACDPGDGKDEQKNPPVDETPKPSIEITEIPDSITAGEVKTVSAKVKNLDNTDYFWTCNPADILSIDDAGNMTVIKAITEATTVRIIAIADADTSVTATRTITVNPKPKVEKAAISFVTIASSSALKYGEYVVIGANVTGVSDTSYTMTVDHPEIATYDPATMHLTVTGEVDKDTYITLTATANADPSVVISRRFLVKAKIQQGDVGELTSDMIEAISGSNITFTGKLTDVYVDKQMSANNTENSYTFTVKMEDGKWNGTWAPVLEGYEDNVISNTYIKGEGDELYEQYIGKDNKAATVPVKNYLSQIQPWYEQHLWNHLGNLDVNKFVFDEDTGYYNYPVSDTDMDTLYLMTYFSFSMTPMLSDTLMTFNFVVKDGKIEKIVAMTELLYYGADTQEDATGYSYSQVEISFSDIGSTVVEAPAPFEIDPDYSAEYALLHTAIEKMHNARNYTFKTAETTTFAPSGDADDYTMDSVKSKAKLNDGISNGTASSGTVGEEGYVTEDAVLIKTTGQYSASMDGKNFHYSWSGMRQFDGYFEEFSYSAKAVKVEADTYLPGMVGTKRVNNKTIFDALPGFNFSEAIFDYSNSYVNKGTTYYVFTLRSTQITRDMAMEVCHYTNAKNGEATTDVTFKITVDGDGNMVSTTFPYNISGVYYGYCTTTYSNVGNTTLPEGVFENYVPREVKTEWSQYITKYFSTTFSTRDSHDADTLEALNFIYGADVAKMLPAPDKLLNTFGDNINGPFYDWKKKENASGEIIYVDSISMTASSTNFDENYMVLDYEEIIATLTEELGKEGFTLDTANSGEAHGSRYATFVKQNLDGEGIEIVVENNFTRWFWIYFYELGEWTFSK